tara:strand:- start:249 stop:3662 length:3414 start_codon:yes stop_codon:yes gene_type:complete
MLDLPSGSIKSLKTRLENLIPDSKTSNSKISSNIKIDNLDIEIIRTQINKEVLLKLKNENTDKFYFIDIDDYIKKGNIIHDEVNNIIEFKTQRWIFSIFQEAEIKNICLYKPDNVIIIDLTIMKCDIYKYDKLYNIKKLITYIKEYNKLPECKTVQNEISRQQSVAGSGKTYTETLNISHIIKSDVLELYDDDERVEIENGLSQITDDKYESLVNESYSIKNEIINNNNYISTILLPFKENAAMHVFKSELNKRLDDLKPHVDLNIEEDKQLVYKCIMKDKETILVLGTIDSFVWWAGNEEIRNECTYGCTYKNRAKRVRDNPLCTINKNTGSMTWGRSHVKMNIKTLIVLDEGQDHDLIYIEALFAIAENTNINIRIMGDKMQSLVTPTNIFNDELYHVSELLLKHKVKIGTSEMRTRRFSHPNLLNLHNSLTCYEKFGFDNVMTDDTDFTREYDENEKVIQVGYYCNIKNNSTNVNNDIINIVMKYFKEQTINKRIIPKKWLIIISEGNLDDTTWGIIVDNINIFYNSIIEDYDCESIEDEFTEWVKGEIIKKEKGTKITPVYCILHSGNDNQTTNGTINKNLSNETVRMVSIRTSKGDGRNHVIWIGANDSNINYRSNNSNLSFHSHLGVATSRQKYEKSPETLAILMNPKEDDFIYGKVQDMLTKYPNNTIELNNKNAVNNLLSTNKWCSSSIVQDYIENNPDDIIITDFKSVIKKHINDNNSGIIYKDNQIKVKCEFDFHCIMRIMSQCIVHTLLGEEINQFDNIIINTYTKNDKQHNYFIKIESQGKIPKTHVNIYKPFMETNGTIDEIINTINRVKMCTKDGRIKDIMKLCGDIDKDIDNIKMQYIYNFLRTVSKNKFKYKQSQLKDGFEALNNCDIKEYKQIYELITESSKNVISRCNGLKHIVSPLKYTQNCFDGHNGYKKSDEMAFAYLQNPILVCDKEPDIYIIHIEPSMDSTNLNDTIDKYIQTYEISHGYKINNTKNEVYHIFIEYMIKQTGDKNFIIKHTEKNRREINNYTKITFNTFKYKYIPVNHVIVDKLYHILENNTDNEYIWKLINKYKDILKECEKIEHKGKLKSNYPKYIYDFLDNLKKSAKKLSDKSKNSYSKEYLLNTINNYLDESLTEWLYDE